MKKSLIWVCSVIGVGAVIALLFGAFTQPRELRLISVSGECLTTVPKDRTAITLRVTTLDTNAATSMKMATAKIAEITDYLKTQDVKMQTTEFNSYEKSEWNRELEKSVVLGIETTIAIEVSADNIEMIEIDELKELAIITKEKLLKYSIPREEENKVEIDLRLYINESADIITQLILYISKRMREIDYYQVLLKVRENMMTKEK